MTEYGPMCVAANHDFASSNLALGITGDTMEIQVKDCNGCPFAMRTQMLFDVNGRDMHDDWSYCKILGDVKGEIEDGKPTMQACPLVWYSITVKKVV